jgi:hypothetical protein
MKYPKETRKLSYSQCGTGLALTFSDANIPPETIKDENLELYFSRDAERTSTK